MVSGFQNRTKGKEISEAWYGRMGKGSALFGGGGNILVDTTAAQNTATNTLLALATYSLPANSLFSVGQGLYIEACGTFAANAQVKSVELDIGGIKFNTGTTTQSGGAWEIDATLFKTGAKAQLAKVEGWLGSTRVAHTISTDTSDDTAAITIAVKALSGSASASDIAKSYFYIAGMR